MLHFSLKALRTDNIWNIQYYKSVHDSLNVGKKSSAKAKQEKVSEEAV